MNYEFYKLIEFKSLIYDILKSLNQIHNHRRHHRYSLRHLRPDYFLHPFSQCFLQASLPPSLVVLPPPWVFPPQALAIVAMSQLTARATAARAVVVTGVAGVVRVEGLKDVQELVHRHNHLGYH